MSDGHHVQTWQAWMSGFKQQVAASIRQIEFEIRSAEFDIQRWDSTKSHLNQIKGEINFLSYQLSTCQANPESSPEEQSAMARKRQAIMSEIASKQAEESDLQDSLDSLRRSLQEWKMVFSDDSHYRDIGLKLQESRGNRAEMAQYQGTVRQAKAIMSGATGPGGRLSGNKYGSEIGSKITAIEDQIEALSTMQAELLDVEKKIYTCYRTAVSMVSRIEDLLGDPDPQFDYGQKHL